MRPQKTRFMREMSAQLDHVARSSHTMALRTGSVIRYSEQLKSLSRTRIDASRKVLSETAGMTHDDKPSG